jgi:hypothetical protein
MFEFAQLRAMCRVRVAAAVTPIKLEGIYPAAIEEIRRNSRLSVAVGTTIADRPPQSGRTVARSGFRMMPTFPSPSLKFRKAGFPRSGFKASVSDRAFHPRVLRGARFASVLRAPRFHRCIPRTVREKRGALEHRPSSSYRCSTPGALAPVRVFLSPSIITYWPHPPHLQAHLDFAA